VDGGGGGQVPVKIGGGDFPIADGIIPGKGQNQRGTLFIATLQ